MFPLDPKGYKYRPLKQGIEGWDVYALQTGLGSVAQDGKFGPQTAHAVRAFQLQERLEDDGVAGVLTQRALVLERLWPVQKGERIPSGLMRGQVEAESSFWVGNHSSKYSNGKYDLGVTQRNLEPTEANCRAAFDVVASLLRYGKNLRAYHDKYLGQKGAKTERRAWELAAGSHNAPAWTDKLAADQSLTEKQRDHIESYISRVTVYLTL